MKPSSFFETRKHESGEEFITLKDGTPDWIREAICAAHSDGHDRPNDWTYQQCRAAFAAVDEGSLQDDDSLHEYTDSQVDIYNGERFQWAADMHATILFSDAEDEAKILMTADADMIDRLGTIQYCAIRRIAHVVLEACNENEDTDVDT